MRTAKWRNIIPSTNLKNIIPSTNLKIPGQLERCSYWLWKGKQDLFVINCPRVPISQKILFRFHISERTILAWISVHISSHHNKDVFALPFHVRKYIFHPNTFNGIRDTILLSRIPFVKVDFKILCGIYFILMLSRFLIVLLEDGPERLLR